MVLQIALGSLILIASIVIAGTVFWLMESSLLRVRPWLIRKPHRPKLIGLICMAALGALGIVTIAVWIWALTFWSLGVFDTLETCVYFALVVFTTLGYGDLLLPQQWQLLGGMAAVNGLMNIGLLTALMLEAGRYVRTIQLEALREQS
ncbi:ion channel [Flavimaricola marinus]|uniref:Ion channel n=1 Tax=Flavimaricola marinus TaxID=1819565 RepID=A0A238LF97_9RHOB|nr:ion channel [Flavimaricola marinus]SMY08387.1 Ion channel [Flavimaricola marinus]